MRYGLPYKGSKNSIAKWIVDELPKADVFVDLFCGGCAVTHRALLSGKYKQFIINDIDGRLPKLFLECAHGKHTIKNHPEWISREEFFARKDNDAYIALVWSFGNNGKDYLYAKDLEEFKKALHYAVFFNDISLLHKGGIFVEDTDETNIMKRYSFFKKQLVQMKNEKVYCENLTRAIEIERLQSLQSLQSYTVDYSEVKIPEGALIYCDIPYNSTNCGKYQGFDHERFYEWAKIQKNIFISEYEMPEDFIPVAWHEKTVLSAANGNAYKNIEKIFTNRITYEAQPRDVQQMQHLNFAEQLDIFSIDI